MGPALLFAPERESARLGDRLVIVDWNLHVGHGDIRALVDKVSADERAEGRGIPNFVFLLQESFRRGREIPAAGDGPAPGRIVPGMDIQDIARELGWWMYYVPSMRNGNGVGDAAEDRGNAVLSSLPLEDLEAVELPFVVQRRVALAATVTDLNKRPLFRIAVAHLDTRAPLSKGWLFGGPSARNGQAESLISALETQAGHLPLVIGGDLNSILGSREPAVHTLSGFAARVNCGGNATHSSGLHLDHVFVRTTTNPITIHCSTTAGRFGSDHHALVLLTDNISK